MYTASRLVSLLAVAAVVASTARAGDPPPPAAAKGNSDDWARQHLQDDPLAAIAQPTLDDLRQALNDPALRDFAMQRHFSRIPLNADQQREFLREALAHEWPRVQQQAAVELKRLGMLSDVTREILLEMSQQDDVQIQQAVVIALQHLDAPDELPEHYRRVLLKALASEDRAVRLAADRQLGARGAAAVPALLEALKSDDPELRSEAAQVLSRIISSRPQPPVEDGARVEDGAATVPKFAPATYTGPRSVRDFQPEAPTTVRLYFGTNRAIVNRVPDPSRRLLLLPVLLFVAVAAVYFRLRGPARQRRRGGVTALILVVCLVVVAWSGFAFNTALRRYLSQHIGTEFGRRRDPGNANHYGWCDVSIPTTHRVGLVEQPLLGPEDESRHVVLQRTELLDQQAFIDRVRRLLAERPESAQDCFVFVHGYNVTFREAACRTAQIYYDLDFHGVPLFYSWPSRGSLHHYVADKNEIVASAEHIKRFLLTVADGFDANRVHVIAHSMGAEGVSRAIASMGEQQRRFDQIVLAAPDIDADVFRTQLAPRIVSQSQRATLYCSRNDMALHASYAFNDSPRIGDSSRAIVVLKGVDTVDASEIDTALLGHSYYGDCLPLLRDVNLLLDRSLPPADRGLNANLVLEGLHYWTFR